MAEKKEIIASIIIPVYNVESYLEECLDSIFVHQEISCPIEVIVVNDGSTDGSLNILNEYKKQHDFILITQENLGIGCARNTGINAATGRYLLFIDSDDYLVPDSLDSLLVYLAVSNVDIVEYDYKIFNKSKRSYDLNNKLPPIVEYGRGQDVFSVWEKNGFYRPMVWTRAVSREMIVSNKLYFYTGMFHEDEEWSPKIYAYAASVRYLPIVIYVYRIRESSCMANKTLKHYMDLLKCVDSLSEFSNTQNLSPEYIKAVRRKSVSIYFWVFSNIKFDGKYNQHLISELEKRRDLIRFSEEFNRKILYKSIIDIQGIRNSYILRYGCRDFLRVKPIQKSE